MASSFKFNLPVEYHMQPGQDVTPRLQVTGIAGGGWGTTQDFSYQGRAVISKLAPGVSADVVGVYDLAGQPLPGNQAQFVNGAWGGYIVFRPGAPFPGQMFVDANIRGDDPQNGVYGNVGTWCRIYLAAAPPVTQHAYEIKNNGVSMGVAMVPEPENVTIFRDGVLIWPNYTGGPR